MLNSNLLPVVVFECDENGNVFDNNKSETVLINIDMVSAITAGGTVYLKDKKNMLQIGDKWFIGPWSSAYEEYENALAIEN